ncbi:MAG: hypothetical protein NPIRA05_15610 [Nitrospirales bacterium]|nr:MAG: hypothetical protein NPIRA05_15610 [Nitrospirales bacterium]
MARRIDPAEPSSWRATVFETRARRARLKSNQVRTYVRQKLHIGWTPELIAGRLQQQTELPMVRHEAIYQ